MFPELQMMQQSKDRLQEKEPNNNRAKDGVRSVIQLPLVNHPFSKLSIGVDRLEAFKR
jgi:hypothetical protein